jgi:hypothetical protein
MEYFIGALVIVWVVNIMLQGYRQERNPPAKPELRDNGSGIMEPICPACRVRLVTLTRESGGAASSVTVWFLALIGLGLLLFAPIFGALALILAVLVGMTKKTRTTVLSCPSCGKDLKTLG